MDEQTTTEAPVVSGGNEINGVPVDDNGSAIPQPENTEPAEAAEATESPQEAPQAQAEAEEPSNDDNSTAKWLKNKGIDPKSPEALEKIAEMARNAEKAMHEKATKASELEKAIDEGITQEAVDTGFADEDRLDLIRIKTKLGVREFFEQNPQAKPLEQAMITELQNKPHLAGDLESLYALAAVKSGSIDEVKSQVKKETLTDLAQKQQASTPRGNATNGSEFSSNTITPQNVDQMVAGMSSEEYRKRLPEINRAISG